VGVLRRQNTKGAYGDLRLDNRGQAACRKDVVYALHKEGLDCLRVNMANSPSYLGAISVSDR
jgi:hypothetical protein